MAKRLDFQASISEVKQVNPLFSTCKVRVLYTGKNRNYTTITKDAVEKALPTILNIPIVGEFSVENEDYKGHGGAIDLDSYRFIHTTKPYGVVPESATFEWEEVKGSDGATRDYLTINGCYLWTGRYEEAFSIIENGKGQSMEIEVTSGEWEENEESYRIDNFTFSALCILGDDVEPAFEDANITSFSLNSDSFKQEFSAMQNELQQSLSNEKGDNDMLKKLLEKYSLTVEDLTAKGIDFNEISEDELEAKIKEVFEIKDEATKEVTDTEPTDEVPATTDEEPEATTTVDETNVEPTDEATEPEQVADETPADETTEQPTDEATTEPEVNVEDYQARITDLEGQLETANQELATLRTFKLDTEKANHAEAVAKVYANFQLTDEEVEGIDIHSLTVDEITEKCYAILGRKMANKKEFSKENKDSNFRLPIGNEVKDDEPKPYGGLVEKYTK